jgi:hypothetical protein
MRIERRVNQLPKDICKASGKICFPNYTDATNTIKRGFHNPRLSRRQSGVRFEVYLCRYCKYFHIGRKNRVQRDVDNKRIRKLGEFV